MSNKTLTFEKLKALSLQLPEKIPYLKMLVIFGSRARGDIHANSDWDFATLYDQEIRKTYIKNNAWAWFEVSQLLGEVLEIDREQIDVVELNNCSPLIAHFVARDGKVLYEKEPGEFTVFQKKAFKSDVEMTAIRRDLRQKLEKNLQRWGV